MRAAVWLVSEGGSALATYRIKYGRFEQVKYISHLDVLRLFARASRRCDLPVAYSEGFNPHPLFVFGMPIPVGTTSEDEYVDITLMGEMAPSEIVDRLNNVMPDSVRILDAVLLPEHAPNIMKSVVASRYRVTAELSPEERAHIIEESGGTEPLIVEKHTKSGTRPTDVRPMIFGVSEEGEALIVTTAAGNQMNLRPELALSALAGKPVTVKTVHRLALLTQEEL